MNKFKTFLLRQYYLFKESKTFINNKHNITIFIKKIVPLMFSLCAGSFAIWFTLNLFNIIQLNKLSFLQCITLYFILMEIDVRYKMFINKRR